MSEKDYKMFDFIKNTMKENGYYEIKTEEGKASIKRLFDAGLINEVEFNTNETHIRKIDVKFLNS